MSTVSTFWTNPAGATLDLSNGAIVGETNWDALVSNLNHLGGANGIIAALAYNSADIALATATMTALTFNGERFDRSPGTEIHSTSSNTDRLTAPIDGTYALVGGAEFAANATGERMLEIELNGSLAIARTRFVPSDGNPCNLHVFAVYDLLATQYARLRAYQASGGSLNVAAQSNWSPWFALVKL